MNRKIYALYYGEEFVATGTAEELAEREAVKKETILFYTRPAYKKRINEDTARKIVVYIGK